MRNAPREVSVPTGQPHPISTCCVADSLLEVPELIAPLSEDPESILDERYDDQEAGHGGYVRSDRLLSALPPMSYQYIMSPLHPHP